MEDLLSLPEKDVMYETAYGSVVISKYINDKLEVAYLPQTDPRYTKYNSLPMNIIYGYTDDGMLTECKYWPDRKIRPVLSVASDPRLASFVDELMTTKFEAICGPEIEKILAPRYGERYLNALDELVLARVFRQYKQQLEDNGVLTEDMRKKQEFFFKRHEI